MKPHYKGVLFASIGSIGWGVGGVCSEWLFKQGTDPHALTVFRMFCGGFIFLAMMPAKANLATNIMQIFRNIRLLLKIILFALLGMLLCQYGYYLCIANSDAGTATMLCYIGPVFVMLASCVLHKKLPKRGEVLALLAAFVGVFLLATKGDFTTLHLNVYAMMWGLGAAFGMIFYTLLPLGLIKTYGSLFVMGVALIIASATLGLIVRVWEIPFEWNLTNIFGLFVVVMSGTVGAFWFFLRGVVLIGAVKASMIAALEPLSAVILSSLLFGTQFLPIDYLGFLTILSSVFVMQF